MSIQQLKLPPDDLFAESDFRWRVSETGYRWQELSFVWDGPINQPENIGLLLVDGAHFGEKFTSRAYRPLKEGSLFRTFAELPVGDKDAMAQFADRYGLLGIAVQAIFPAVEISELLGTVYTDTPDGPKPATAKELKGVKRRPVGKGEVFEDWIQAIRDMARAVKLHTILSSNNTRQLKKHLTREKGLWIYADEDDFNYSTFIESRDWQLPDDNERPAAQLCLQRWINTYLSNYTSPQLLWDRSAEKHVFRFMPKNLLGAMWMAAAGVSRALSASARGKKRAGG
jgi:hypothetical protein